MYREDTLRTLTLRYIFYFSNMLRVTQIEEGRKWISEELPQTDAPISGKAFEEYGIVVLLANKKGQIVDRPDCLKDIEEPTWIILGDEDTTWEELERFLKGFTPEELKVMKAKVED